MWLSGVFSCHAGPWVHCSKGKQCTTNQNNTLANHTHEVGEIKSCRDREREAGDLPVSACLHNRSASPRTWGSSEESEGSTHGGIVLHEGNRQVTLYPMIFQLLCFKMVIF